MVTGDVVGRQHENEKPPLITLDLLGPICNRSVAYVLLLFAHAHSRSASAWMSGACIAEREQAISPRNLSMRRNCGQVHLSMFLVLSWVLRGLVLITRQFACLGVPCRLVLVARPAFLDVPWVEFHVGRLGWAPRSYCQACLRFY